MSESADVDGSAVARISSDRFATLRFVIVGTGAAAWNAVKNLIKPFIGRERSFDEQGLFLWQYLLHITRLRPIRAITCIAYPTEGPGAQALSVMNAINFARYTGLTYLHTPFKVIQHADRPMEEWAAAWETLFNLGAGEEICEAKPHKSVNHWHNMPALELCFGRSHCRHQINQHFESMIPEFRSKYYLGKSSRMAREVTIAVHIRRGWDVSPTIDPFVRTESILRIVSTAKAVLDAQNIQHRISVYSEGSRADFEEFFIPGVNLSKFRVGHYSKGKGVEIEEGSHFTDNPFHDLDAISAMKELIEADILIMSKSSFCYYAALISDGIKFFANDRKDGPPIEGWILFARDGSFDRGVFDRQLFMLVRAKESVDATDGAESETKGLCGDTAK
jgi:hypothetical protein